MSLKTFYALLELIEALLAVLAKLQTEPEASVVEPTPEPTPTPTPEPEIVTPKSPPPNPKHYVQQGKRGQWSEKLENAYSVWRGEREYVAILSNGREFLKGGERELVPYTETEIRQFMEEAIDAGSRSERLRWRIENELHRTFEDRMQVRKAVVNQMYHELIAITDQYHRVASSFPPVHGCDSIACKLEKGF